MLVAVDYFTKWVEVKPLATISGQNVQKYLLKNIITCFGIQCVIMAGNGLQFIDKKSNEFMIGLDIKHRVTFEEHPQTNGQVKVAIKVILTELKKRLGSAKGTEGQR